MTGEKEEPLDENNKEKGCDDWNDKLWLFADAPLSIYFLLVHGDKSIESFGLYWDLLDKCSDVWTSLAYNVFKFFCWVRTGDKISSTVSLRTWEE